MTLAAFLIVFVLTRPCNHSWETHKISHPPNIVYTPARTKRPFRLNLDNLNTLRGVFRTTFDTFRGAPPSLNGMCHRLSIWGTDDAKVFRFIGGNWRHRNSPCWKLKRKRPANWQKEWKMAVNVKLTKIKLVWPDGTCLTIDLVQLDGFNMNYIPVVKNRIFQLLLQDDGKKFPMQKLLNTTMVMIELVVLVGSNQFKYKIRSKFINFSCF